MPINTLTTKKGQPYRLVADYLQADFDQLARLVCLRFNLPRRELFRVLSHNPHTTKARHTLMYLCRYTLFVPGHRPGSKRAVLSYQLIAVLFGLNDHTTILHGINKVERGKPKYDPDLLYILQRLKRLKEIQKRGTQG